MRLTMFHLSFRILSGMGLTKQYLRYVHDGTCNVVASSSGTVAAISDNLCAAAACENVYIYNIRTAEKVCYLCQF